jgi:AcrR family transcriptional regulator
MKKTVNKLDKKSRNLLKPKAHDLFDQTASKSQLQQIKIIEAAISSFASKGIDGTTYSSLALDCGISRPLINHYFATLEDLFLLTAKYVRQTLLNLALEEMQKTSSDPRSQLEGYLSGCVRWIQDYPAQFSFWLLYFYQASLKGVARIENSNLVAAGQERLELLLKDGHTQGAWVAENPKEMAKLIQILITGTLVCTMTEEGYMSVQRAKPLLKKAIFDLLPKP